MNMIAKISSFNSFSPSISFNPLKKFLNTTQNEPIEVNRNKISLTVIERDNNKNALSSITDSWFTVEDVKKLLNIELTFDSLSPSEEQRLTGTDLIIFISKLNEDEFANRVSSLQVDNLRGFVHLLSPEELKTLVSRLSAQKLNCLFSALEIKRSLTGESVKNLTNKFDGIQCELNNLVKNNDALNFRNLTKQFYLTSVEKHQFQEMVSLGNELINKAQETISKMQSTVRIGGNQDAAQEELKNQLLNCCELIQLIEALKTHKELIIPEFSKPGWIKSLESNFFTAFINNSPNLVTSIASCLVLAEFVVLSALQMALLGLILTVLVFGFKGFSALAASVYEDRYSKKIEDTKIIRETIFHQLYQSLEQELNVSGNGGIKPVTKVELIGGLNTAGNKIGTKLDRLEKKLDRLSLNPNANSVGGASVSQQELRDKLETDFSTATKEFCSELTKLLEENGHELSTKTAKKILKLLVDKQEAKKYYSLAVDGIVSELKLDDQVKNALFASRKGNDWWSDLIAYDSCLMKDIALQHSSDRQAIISKHLKSTLNQANASEILIRSFQT